MKVFFMIMDISYMLTPPNKKSKFKVNDRSIIATILFQQVGLHKRIRVAQ